MCDDVTTIRRGQTALVYLRLLSVLTGKEKEDNENKLVEPKKKGRGRPPGAKNKKVKSKETNVNTKMVIKRGGGIVSSSTV